MFAFLQGRLQAPVQSAHHLGVFLILAFQFRSYVEPLVVMVAIPFALMGAVGATR